MEAIRRTESHTDPGSAESHNEYFGLHNGGVCDIFPAKRRRGCGLTAGYLGGARWQTEDEVRARRQSSRCAPCWERSSWGYCFSSAIWGVRLGIRAGKNSYSAHSQADVATVAKSSGAEVALFDSAELWDRVAIFQRWTAA